MSFITVTLNYQGAAPLIVQAQVVSQLPTNSLQSAVVLTTEDPSINSGLFVQADGVWKHALSDQILSAALQEDQSVAVYYNLASAFTIPAGAQVFRGGAPVGATPAEIPAGSKSVWTLLTSAINTSDIPGLNTQLLTGWGNAEAFDQFVLLTEDANGVTLTANIKWPDGTSGVFTTDTVNTTFSAIDGWHATYLGTTTKTVTQPTVTRRVSDGKVTTKPSVVIS